MRRSSSLGDLQQGDGEEATALSRSYCSYSLCEGGEDLTSRTDEMVFFDDQHDGDLSQRPRQTGGCARVGERAGAGGGAENICILRAPGLRILSSGNILKMN